MKLVIGGYAQGKLDYVLCRYRLQEAAVWDGILPIGKERQGKTVVIDHFHRWVRQRLEAGGCPEEEIRSFLESCKDCIIISDEIGSGIVPIESSEREYRERAGRIQVQLAAQAEEVWRIICGIGQRIK